MTPGARVAAAAGLMDEITAGMPAEQALTRWARSNRYAGSKDRAAVRDHVFDVLRLRETAACLGGGETGRSLMLGLLRAQGLDPADFFTGEGHAPAPLSDVERAVPTDPEDCVAMWNLPDWLVPELSRSVAAPRDAARQLQRRAPVVLRVNLARVSREAAQSHLAKEGVGTQLNPLCDTALTVVAGARRLRQSACYRDGLVELQDAASQAVVAGLPDARRCLDYCAGGGGKSLALAAQPGREVHAHDIDPARMKDLPARSARAGAAIAIVPTEDLAQAAPYDLVLCDAPCSGSGAWRRSPEAKWSFTPERLDALGALQDGILDRAADLVAPDGWLIYATCSLLRAENEDRIERFLARHPRWRCTATRRFDIGAEGDGFFTAHLTQRAE